MGLMADILGKFAPMTNQQAIMNSKSSSREKLDELWSVDTRRRKPREQQWQLNIAMTLGNQWVGWNGTRIETLQAPSWRIQAVDNKIFVRVRSKQTRLLADMVPTAIPDSSDHLDLRRARYKERLLNHIRREIGDFQLRFRASQWLVVCGEVYTEALWDESAGDTYACDGGAFSDGDVRVRIWDPFAVWPGAGASAGNNGGRLWTADVIPVELARLKYNDAKISPDAGEVTDLKLRASLDSFFSSGSRINQQYGEEKGQLDECVVVKVLREYRTAALPQGRRRTIINGNVVDEQPLLWDGITHIINYPSFNSYHGDPVELRQSIQRQKSYNRLLSNWEEYVRTCQKGKILAPDTMTVKSSQFDSEHMEIIRYKGSGPPPTPWMPPPLPSDTAQLMGLNVAAIEDYWADHAASQGKAPASASGTAINFLQEEDQRNHYGSRDSWLGGWARTYEKCLDVVAGNSGKGGYDETRMITVLGEDRRADIERFNPDLVMGRNRIYIAMGGALPENKTLRAEVARRWFVDGVLGDPTSKETRRKFLKMVDAGLVDDVYDDEYLDEIRAEKENESLASGQMVPPRPEDDHAVHAWTIKHWMKSDDFLELSPQTQELFYAHLSLHEELAAAAMMPPPSLAPPVGNSAPGNPATSPAVSGPGDLLKSAVQGAGPPPSPGMQNETAEVEEGGPTD